MIDIDELVKRLAARAPNVAWTVEKTVYYYDVAGAVTLESGRVASATVEIWYARFGSECGTAVAIDYILNEVSKRLGRAIVYG